jgi:hypothetical protein
LNIWLNTIVTNYYEWGNKPYSDSWLVMSSSTQCAHMHTHKQERDNKLKRIHCRLWLFKGFDTPKLLRALQHVPSCLSYVITIDYEFFIEYTTP